MIDYWEIDADKLSSYGYVNNLPTLLLDPSGLGPGKKITAAQCRKQGQRTLSLLCGKDLQ